MQVKLLPDMFDVHADLNKILLGYCVPFVQPPSFVIISIHSGICCPVGQPESHNYRSAGGGASYGITCLPCACVRVFVWLASFHPFASPYHALTPSSMQKMHQHNLNLLASIDKERLLYKRSIPRPFHFSGKSILLLKRYG